MLSRRSFILAVLVVILASPLSGLAQEKDTEEGSKSLFSFKTDDRESLFGEYFTFKAGYKVWIAKWQAPTRIADTSGPVHSTADHPSFMHGPTLSGRVKLRDGEWFNSIFFSVTSIRDGFDFSEQGTTNLNHSFANRRDTFATAGVTIWESLGIFGGYYTSDQQFSFYNITTPSIFTRQKRTLQGPIFGFVGSGQISDRVAVYGNIAYALLQVHTGVQPGSVGVVALQGNISTNSVHGYATEFGLNIIGPRIWKIGTELQAGFRAQIINKTVGQNPTSGPYGAALNDITYGPIFTINAVF